MANGDKDTEKKEKEKDSEKKDKKKPERKKSGNDMVDLVNDVNDMLDEDEEKEKDGKKKDDDSVKDYLLTAGVFIAGCAAFGVGFLVAALAILLVGLIAKKGWDYFHDKDPKEVNNDVVNQALEKNNGKLPEDINKYLDLAKDPKNFEQYCKNIEGYVNQFAQTEEGKKFLNNKALNAICQKYLGKNCEQLVQICKEGKLVETAKEADLLNKLSNTINNKEPSEEEKKKAEEEAKKKAEEEAKKKAEEEAKKKSEEEKKKEEDEKKKSEEDKKKEEDEKKRAEEQKQKEEADKKKSEDEKKKAEDQKETEEKKQEDKKEEKVDENKEPEIKEEQEKSEEQPKPEEEKADQDKVQDINEPVQEQQKEEDINSISPEEEKILEENQKQQEQKEVDINAQDKEEKVEEQQKEEEIKESKPELGSQEELDDAFEKLADENESKQDNKKDDAPKEEAPEEAAPEQKPSLWQRFQNWRKERKEKREREQAEKDAEKNKDDKEESKEEVKEETQEEPQQEEPQQEEPQQEAPEAGGNGIGGAILGALKAVGKAIWSGIKTVGKAIGKGIKRLVLGKERYEKSEQMAKEKEAKAKAEAEKQAPVQQPAQKDKNSPVKDVEKITEALLGDDKEKDKEKSKSDPAQAKGKDGESKDDKEKDKDDKDKEKDNDTAIKAGLVGIAVSMVALGGPATIAIVALIALIGLIRKIWDLKNDKSEPENAIEGAHDTLEKNTGKENTPALEDCLKLTKDKDGNELSKEDFMKNCMGIVQEFSKSKEGKELLNNPLVQTLAKGVLGVDLNKALGLEDPDKSKENQQEKIEEKKEEKDKNQITNESNEITNESNEITNEDKSKLETKDELSDGKETKQEAPEQEAPEAGKSGGFLGGLKAFGSKVWTGIKNIGKKIGDGFKNLFSRGDKNAEQNQEIEMAEKVDTTGLNTDPLVDSNSIVNDPSINNERISVSQSNEGFEPVATEDELAEQFDNSNELGKETNLSLDNDSKDIDLGSMLGGMGG